MAVVVEIYWKDKVPPAFFVGDDVFNQVSLLVEKGDDAAPFQTNDQVFAAVAVEVGEAGAGDEADGGEARGVGIGDIREFAGAIVFQEIGAGRFSVVEWGRAAAYKEICFPVPIEIEGSDCRGVHEQVGE